MQLHPKMIFAKVPGSKQTILAASSKKTVLVPAESIATIKIKVPPPQKVPILRQTVLKTPPSQPPQPSSSSSVKIQLSTPKQIKRQEPKTPTQVRQQTIKSPLIAKKPETEPIRVAVRKTMSDALIARIKATDDLKLTQDEVKELTLNIELELYKYFKDTGAKYKAKYRSLVFNIKDTKNLTLFRKIADRSLTPDAVVRLSPEEMASQELAEWREKETKHQLDMIKKNELDLMAQAKSIVVKTHKGELVIENDRASDNVDSKSSVHDIVTALNSENNIDSTEINKKEDDLKKLKFDDKKDKEKYRSRDREKGKKRDRSKNRHRHSRERERSKDRKSGKNKDNKKEKDREREKGRDRDKEKKHKKSKSKSHKSHKEYNKEKEKIQEEIKKEEKKELTPPRMEPPIEDRLWRHIDDDTTTIGFVNLDTNDSDLSDREPSSTVNIKTPDINEDFEREKEVEPEEERTSQQTVWSGFVCMPDVAKFYITAQEVSGNSRDLMEDLPNTVDVVGRIGHDTVWDYISKMKKNGSKEILVIRLTAANDEEKIPYITLYSYLNSRSRLGVVGNVSKSIKDFYIMPFSNFSKVPSVLLPLKGHGFEEEQLLLGIIVRNKRKRIASSAPLLPAMPTKIIKKDSDRSYTPPPPLVHLSPKDKNPSPPTSPRLHHKGITDSLPESKHITQHTLETLNKAQIGMSRTILDSATISKIVPELSSRIDLTSKPQDEDDDEPYSPGEMDEDLDNNDDIVDDDDDDGDDGSKDMETELLSTNKDSNSELQRKMDEINRQIEEQKQQIQNISSSFLGDVTNTLPVRYLLSSGIIQDFDSLLFCRLGINKRIFSSFLPFLVHSNLFQFMSERISCVCG